MSQTPFDILTAVFLLGMIGAALGAWMLSRSARAQRDAQETAFELAREKAQRDLQQALLCLPQWVHQSVRVELELVGRQLAGRSREQFLELQRWQSEQDERRLAEWRALLSSLAPRPAQALPPVPRTDQPAPAYGPKHAPVSAPPDLFPEPMAVPLPQSAPVDRSEESERQFSDQEIDASPPDLPASMPSQRKKLPTPKKPVVRKI